MINDFVVYFYYKLTQDIKSSKSQNMRLAAPCQKIETNGLKPLLYSFYKKKFFLLKHDMVLWTM